MKTKTIIIVASLFILCIFISIREYIKLNDELRKIKQQNEELLLINKERKMDKIVGYQTVVVPKKFKIKLGEEFTANIYWAYIQPVSITNVVVGDIFEHCRLKKNIDTLNFDDKYKAFIYKNTPTKPGIHTWGGIISVNNFENKTDKYCFTSQYIVEK